jgi:FtsP/CotA-like multicopper oxidase with cupredoxin domain
MSRSLVEMTVSRRRLMTRAGAGVLGAALPSLTLRGSAASEYTLVATERPLSLLPGKTTPALSYGDGFPSPVLRVRQGESLRVRLINRLTSPTTIHWHGVRLPNAMDGVPTLTQAPVAPGDEFVYEFTPPDAGTFWYHPHYDSLVQLNHGLAGALIVEERDPPSFDADLLLILKDWNLDAAGQFNPLTTPKAAGRAGTFGGHHTVNGAIEPTYDIPAGGLCRLRLLNIDVTRIFKIVLESADASIIALDGHSLAGPLPLQLLSLGPGMRADLSLRAPSTPGTDIHLVNISASAPWVMATLRSAPPTRPLADAELRLAPNPIPEPDLAGAEVLSFAFAAGAGGGSIICGSATPQPMLWSINKQAWSEVPALMPPLAGLRLGRSYILELQNGTPRPHPIHLHGFAFKVLHSSERAIVPYFADTALLSPKERLRVAFVADNPGDWMLHCHIIEHQATGMTGYLHVA